MKKRRLLGSLLLLLAAALPASRTGAALGTDDVRLARAISCGDALAGAPAVPLDTDTNAAEVTRSN